MRQILKKYQMFKTVVERNFTQGYRQNIAPLLKLPNRTDFARTIKAAEMTKFEYNLTEILWLVFKP